MTLNPTLPRTKRKTLLLLFITTFYIVIIIGNEMIIGRYALIMTIYYYGKHNIYSRAHAHTPRKQLYTIILSLTDGRTLQATVNAADGPKRVHAPDKWSHCRRRRLRLLCRRRSKYRIQNH